MLAGGKLLDDVLDVSGLTMRNEVQQTVLKLANKQGVKVHQTKMKVEDPVNVLKDLGETPKQSEIACLAAVSSSARIRDLVMRAQDDWMIEAEDALARNKSTLAVQSMDRLLGNDGILAALRAKGYTVEGP